MKYLLVRKNVNRIQAALGEYAYSRSQPVISCDVVVVINLRTSQMQFSQRLVEEKEMLLGFLFFTSVVLLDISIGRYTQ